MTCYQSTTLPSGVTTTGRTAYTTEAECNQACKEGACCEGTTCTVKPQCQCQCTTGRCCGPDTTTAGGTTWKTCRNESKAACDARGGVYQCGVPCTTGVIGDAAGSTAGSVCLNGTGDVANAGPVFRGVGTVCAGNPCVADNISQCITGGCTGCNSLPSNITATIEFSGFAPVTDVNFDQDSTYRYAWAAAGCDPASVVITAPIACFQESGEWTNGEQTCVGDCGRFRFGLPPSINFYMRCKQTVSMAVAMIGLGGLEIAGANTAYRNTWPYYPNFENAGPSWADFVQHVGEFNTIPCQNACGSATHTQDFYIATGPLMSRKVAEWTLTLELSGCNGQGNPLP
jgi:hypothetical protein